MRVPYSRRYKPAAPVLEVRFAATESGDWSAPVKAFVDTGADGTLAPLRLLLSVGAKRAETACMRSQWGETRVAFSYLVDIQIGQVRLSDRLGVGDDQGNEIVLGRDGLRALRLLLDGPAQMLEIR